MATRVISERAGRELTSELIDASARKACLWVSIPIVTTGRPSCVDSITRDRADNHACAFMRAPLSGVLRRTRVPVARSRGELHGVPRTDPPTSLDPRRGWSTQPDERVGGPIT